MSSSTVMKQGIHEKCIDWAKSVVDSAISTPPLLSGEHISEHTYMSGPLYGYAANVVFVALFPSNRRFFIKLLHIKNSFVW